MPSQPGEKSQPQAPPKSADPLPCPRCQSVETKFCYYNNYNISQPRHYCKACRRFWTHGGTLRNVPVGGATRKNSKRRRSSSPASNFISTEPEPEPERKPLLLPAKLNTDLAMFKCENSSGDLNLKEKESENFISLLNASEEEAGFMVGYGLWGDGSELLNGDWFTWPAVAISTPAKGLNSK